MNKILALNKSLSLRRYFGKNYDEFITLKKLYTIFKTGKSAKKSTEIARYIVLMAFLDQRFCAVVLRKVLLDHEKSTFPAIIKAFNRLQEQTGYN
ncbi:phage terminase large subunit [Herbiconiux daphne]|uniref:Phage terminase large subunit n=1 Tax=Herbiconiux daphne TaxID=2970914 RepID=A0ABT2H987_9MICO|nr:phage terminase large subunit [Herbiconiux daphne]MCS5736520.1 phage terminase large subunit [Herbiconiux daphne]